MAHHVFRRGIFDTSLLESWAATYNPLVLFGFEEDSGTTAVDSSGDGNDGTYEGEIAYNETTVFDGANPAVSLGVPSVAQGKLSVPALSPSSQSTTFALAYGEDPLAETYMWDTSGGQRLVLGHNENNGPLGFFTNSWVLTEYTCRGPAFIHWTFREASSSANISIRGLPIAELPWTPTLLGTNGGYINARYSGSSEERSRKYAIAERLDRDLSHGEIYQQALDIKAAPEEGHYYKTKIIDDLGLAALGQQGDVLCHLPLWEAAGPQAVDVSMRENHADFVGGPLLGQDPPPDSGLLYSVDHQNNNSDIGYTVPAGYNYGQNDWTISCEVKWRTITDRGQICVQGADGTAFVADLRYDATDTNNELIVYSGGIDVSDNTGLLDDGNWHRVTIRQDVSAGELAMWVDGALIGKATGGTYGVDTSTSNLHFGRNPADVTNTAGGWSGLTAGPIAIGRALTDAECEAL